MNRPFLLISLLTLACFAPFPCVTAQTELRVDDSFSAERLVADIFASDQCETITNVRQIGNRSNGIGFFEAPAGILGFDRGIIISTGNVNDATGPNRSSRTGEDQNGLRTDVDLDRIATSELRDVSGIEFDFTPLQEEVSFRFVFASEEYCDFINAEFNDLFGFFVSGPGISGPFSDGAVNVALVPGTDEAVSIKNINHQRNSDLYLDNEFPTIRDESNCGGSDTPGPRFQDIEYDGQTVVLTASIRLQTCVQYRMRMVIADVDDAAYDSAVFLEAGSFDIGGSVAFEGGGSDEPARTIFEGCAPTMVRIMRGEDSDITKDRVINYTFDAGSTALPGVDFNGGSGTVTIPAGAAFAEIAIEAFADGIAEGPEDLILTLDIPCACFTDFIRLRIEEPAALALELDEAAYCPDQAVTLQPSVSGGAPPYRYRWSFGSQEATPRLTPPLPASIGVTVTDACGQEQRQTVASFSTAPPAFTLPDQTLQACFNEPQSIAFSVSGTEDIRLVYNVNGSNQDTLTLMAGAQQLPVARSGNYRFVEVYDAACATELSDRIQVNFYRPAINVRTDLPNCNGDRDGAFTATHLRTVAPYTYNWSGGVSPDSLSAVDLPAGEYGLTVTDGLGCTDERLIVLREPAPLQPVTFNCNQVRRPPLRPSARGGSPPYSYRADGGPAFGSEGFANLVPGEFYRLEITDSRGCYLEQPDFFYPETGPRSVRLPTFIAQELAGSARIEPELLVPLDQIDTVRWLPPELFTCATCLETEVMAPVSQPISLLVSNVYGCVDSLVTFVGVDNQVPIFVPNVFSPNGDNVNDRVSIFADARQVEEVLEFQIYNRWGGLVYAAENLSPNNSGQGWDGRMANRIAPIGAYAWRARFRLTTGLEQTEFGTVVLLKTK